MEIKIDLSSPQSKALEFLNDDITTEILYGGSAGGGKTWLGCVWLIINCIRYPGTRWLMGRSKLKSLKASTLKTFFDIASNFKMTDEHFKYNSNESEIRFYNGSTIMLKDLFTYPSDPNFDSLGSVELTGAFIDEVNQISEKAKNIVSSRIRYKLKTKDWDIMPKLLMSCNPATNWVYTEFYKKDRDHELEDYKKFIPALVTDNPHISKHYVQNLQKLDENSKKRLLYGQWEFSDKLALMDYDMIIDSFKDYEYSSIDPDYYISVDVARKGKDKCVIMLWDNLKVIKIVTMDISLLTEIKDEITKLKNEYRINNNKIVIDEDGVGGGLVDFMRGSKGFLNNGRPFKGENYQNLKTQCYYKLSELVNNGEIEIYNCELDVRESLVQELQIVKQKNVDRDGKLQILSKDEIKMNIGRSPDYSDAMMMRMYFEFQFSGISFTI